MQTPKIVPDMHPEEDSTALLARGLEGKCVDEFGNILDWNGTVLGRVEGDLPSMVGRSVCKDGRILDASGDVSGCVSENFISPPPSPDPDEPSRKRKRTSAEHDANTLYDSNGQVLGTMKKNSPSKVQSNTVEGCESCRARRAADTGEPPKITPIVVGSDQQQQSGDGIPRTGPAAPSPSEIYLDVKSTHDGIQLTIKIPTVFNGGGGGQDKAKGDGDAEEHANSDSHIFTYNQQADTKAETDTDAGADASAK